MLRGIAFQLVLFYLITSYFRGGSKTATTDSDGSPIEPADNLFPFGQDAVRETVKLSASKKRVANVINIHNE